ncbi:MAG: glycosyltransferase family 4 protein [Acidobacteriaceae bacterium]|nr:glycosyltransferase family 4 protein [Acidobacteriaceae bacterium]MBV9765047.1 glycosyltransferase family 4 protein [Acidobacteriaceae bacterium]
MKIWIFFQYASTPDQQFTGPYDIAKCLVRKGHEVTFFASSFSQYKFQELRLQPGEKSRIEDVNGVKFVWIRTPPYSKNDWRRIRNMLAYSWRAFWIARRFQDRPDAIIGVCNHPIAALIGYWISVVKRSRFFYEVRDLWPLTLVRLGILKERSLVTKLLSMLELFLFRKAEKIIMVWPKMDDYGVERHIPREKFVWIPQCVDVSRYDSLRPYDGRASDPFTIMYLGGHVSANAIEVILRAARVLQAEKFDHVRFVFVGDGHKKSDLIKMAKDLDLKNVEFWDVVPRNELPRVMNAADAFVLSMKNLPGLYKYGISWNKLSDYLVAGRPILLAGNPAYNPVTVANAGLGAPPEDPEALAQAVKELIHLSPEVRARMGANGRRYALQTHDAVVLADRLEAILQARSESSSAGAGQGLHGVETASPVVSS